MEKKLRKKRREGEERRRGKEINERERESQEDRESELLVRTGKPGRLTC